MKASNLPIKRIVILAILIIFTVGYFWTQSRYPSLGGKAGMAATGELAEESLSFRALLEIPKNASAAQRVGIATINWVYTNKEGMTFGIILAALLLTLLSYLPDFGNAGFFDSVKGVCIGAPLGVCVNCAAPIAKSMIEGKVSRETAMAMMFSSPSFNIIVLGMMFALLPLYVVGLKLFVTLLFILIIVPLILGKSPKIAPKRLKKYSKEHLAYSLKVLASDFLKNLWFIIKKTVPFMFLAGFLGVFLLTLLPFNSLTSLNVNIFTLVLVAFIGTFLPAPIAFDVAIAYALYLAGLPMAFVVVLLVTLGIYSIYPFFIVSQTISRRVAISFFIAVMCLGVVSGYAADKYEGYKQDKTLKYFYENKGLLLEIKPKYFPKDEFPALSPPEINTQKFYEDNKMVIGSYEHGAREKGKALFEKLNSSKIGLDIGLVDPEEIFYPAHNGRGISSGDINNDGWIDLAVGTNNGAVIFFNTGGQSFYKYRIPGTENFSIFVAALADINNDNLLDLYITSYYGKNFVLLNKNGFENYETISVPNDDAWLTRAAAFGDINRNGFLDIVQGNYAKGNIGSKPSSGMENNIIINNNLNFSQIKLNDPYGITISVLLTDFNDDRWLDLLIGNDFEVSDQAYIGNKNGFAAAGNEIMPITTRFTMSLDTADINNDLFFDLYAGGISTNSAGDDLNVDIQQQYAYLNNNYFPQDLENYKELYEFYLNDEITSCENFAELAKPHCIVRSFADFAIQRKKLHLCNEIPDALLLYKTYCKNYFEEIPQKEVEKGIPQQMHDNVLLMGNGKTFSGNEANNYGVENGFWSWNSKFADFDNDEWQDLYIVQGFFKSEPRPNKFYHSIKGTKFESKEEEFGLLSYAITPAYTYIDYDNDGDLDIINYQNNGRINLYKNNEYRNNAITFEVNDHVGNSKGIGSKIFVHYGNKSQVREIKSGGGYLSFDAPRAHFGLGNHETIDKAEFQWPDGEKTIIAKPLKADHHYIITRKKI